MATYEPISFTPPTVQPQTFGFEFCDGGVCVATGISAAGVHAGFRADPNRLDLSVVVADKPCTCAATFTQNRFCAAPVQVSRPRAAKGVARAVMLNSGNANASTGEQGMAVARESSAMLAAALGCEEDQVLVGSTGVIGQQQAMDPYVTGVPLAVQELGADAEHAHLAARAIMTTDTVPKEVSLCGTLPMGEGEEPLTVHIGGFVKGSGMIMPNMATMLAVLTTDAPLTHEVAQKALLAAVRMSFNKVTVDSDTSTNDSCFLLATGAAGGEPIAEDSEAFEAFAGALRVACETLARKIAADGEGATKLVTVDVLGCKTAEDADTVARSIANSPLVKTAIFGHDANWGRVAAAAGKCGVYFDQYDVDIDLLGVPVLRAGMPLPMDEEDLLRRFEEPEVPIVISLGQGDASARIWTCDFSHEYVTINGDYRT